MGKVRSGLDALLAQNGKILRGKRVGVLCHQASVDARLRHIIPLLHARKIDITVLFAPEHGLWGTAQDQVPISDVTPAKAGVQNSGLDSGFRRNDIKIHSLYGDHRSPSEAQLKEIDILLCDLQDVGSRYYTFVWTMALAMQACAKFGKQFIVLDRPNPINGLQMEGPILDLNFASFVGLYPVPVRHGLTIGEMALWLNEKFRLRTNMDVIGMKGWKRGMNFDDTGLPWILPSPNMPTLETAYVYPGTCLIEGTKLSEGRGTTRPFELIGAPFIDGDKLADLLNKENLPGAAFRACRFEPTFHKFQGQSCGGVQIHATDRKRFEPFLAGLTLIQRARELYPEGFAWRDPPYEYETEKLPFDILCGTDAIRKTIEAGRPVKTLRKSWQAECAAFARERRSFLLYN
jgi:uncharacterized protein YbbC (DUF1343 family)